MTKVARARVAKATRRVVAKVSTRPVVAKATTVAKAKDVMCVVDQGMQPEIAPRDGDRSKRAMWTMRATLTVKTFVVPIRMHSVAQVARRLVLQIPSQMLPRRPQCNDNHSSLYNPSNRRARDTVSNLHPTVAPMR